MAIIGGIMVPHPPLIVPEVGKGEERVIEETTRAYEKAADFVAALKPDTIVLSSPHVVMYGDYLHICPGDGAGGNLRQFNAPGAGMNVDYDTELRDRIVELCAEVNFPAGTEGERSPELDHGTMVPLYFILKKYKDFRLVRLGISGISLLEHYSLGMMIKKAAEELDRRVLYVASGDLSHKLQVHGPYGFDPAGPEYDKRIMDVMGSGEFERLLDFEPELLEKSAECGHRSFVIMAGAFDRTALEIERLSHQDVTGVGYGICTFRVRGEDPKRNFFDRWYFAAKENLEMRKNAEDEYISLARQTIESYIRDGKIIKLPEGLPSEMLEKKAGAFVSLHINGALRGCIGTILPVRASIAEEIVSNAISAATRDPRFSPVREDELPFLEYSVDILNEPEEIASEDQLDVKRYGVIVTKGMKRGLLLPNLDGVDTIEEQVAIAKQKAGISVNDKDVQLERFEVTRHEV